MNELEKKFSCLCGSEVKEANRKAHEKTKKHTNYQQTHSTSNLMPVHNLPVPKAVRKLQQRSSGERGTKRKYDEVDQEHEEDDNYEDDEDAYADGVDPEHEQGDEEDDGFEEELMQALELIHKGIEELTADKVNLRNDLRLNLHKTVTDVGFVLNPILDDIKYRLKCIEDKLTVQLPSSNSSVNPVEQPKWINDKCTPRN
jgi:hypothetical protein